MEITRMAKSRVSAHTWKPHQRVRYRLPYRTQPKCQEIFTVKLENPPGTIEFFEVPEMKFDKRFFEPV